MTVLDAIKRFDDETENDIPIELKKEWLSEIDKKIAKEINYCRSGLSEEAYTFEKADDFILCAIDSYSEIYIVYLTMKMNYMLAEIERYNNSANIFNRLYYEMTNYISRNYKYNVKNSIKVELNNV